MGDIGSLILDMAEKMAGRWGAKNRHDIADIAADLALRAVQAMRQYDERRGSVETYVYTVMRRHLYGKATQSKKVTVLVESDVVKFASEDDRSLVELFIASDRVEEIVEEHIVSRFMSRLTSVEKMVVMLLMEGYSATEVGTKLRLSKGRISQIRSKIREKFLQFVEEEDI